MQISTCCASHMFYLIECHNFYYFACCFILGIFLSSSFCSSTSPAASPGQKSRKKCHFLVGCYWDPALSTIGQLFFHAVENLWAISFMNTKVFCSQCIKFYINLTNVEQSQWSDIWWRSWVKFARHCSLYKLCFAFFKFS